MNERLITKNIIIAGIVVLVVYAIGFATDTQYNRIHSLVGTLAWPLIVIFSVLFFRRIFTYLFFSINEFNFFGAKGTLKDVQTVISERVEHLRNQDKLEVEKQKEVKEFEKKLTIASRSKEEALALAKQVVDMYKQQSEENRQLKSKADELDRIKSFTKALEERAKNETA